MICPVCYGKIVDNLCDGCSLHLDDQELMKLKADTYDSIIKHLLESGNDARRREQARCKIALRNIKGWAKENKDKIDRLVE